MKSLRMRILVALIAVCIVLCSGVLVITFSHKVTYDLNGGQGVKSKYVWQGEDVKLKTPTKYGYIFTGWENKYGKVVDKLENVKGDTTLHATWELNPEFYGDFPVIEVNTKYGTIPDSKQEYVTATLNMYNCQNEDYNLENKDIGIRLRGNSTMKYDKKPYRIKFDKKTSMLGLEKNKSWVLLADYLDQSSIRNYTAFNIAQQMDNLPFANSTNHVILTINGEYQGLYLLTEQIDEKEGRTGVSVDSEGEDIDISVTDTSFPFLVEMDRNALKEGIKGVDNFSTPFYPCEIKYPEADERNIPAGETDVVYNYIKEYVNASFTALKTGEAVEVSFNDTPMTFYELVDVDSFIEFWLVNEIMRNTDSIWGSVYMCKTQTGKLTFGPVWDFDWSMSSVWTGNPYMTTQIELARQTYLLTNGSMLDWFIKDQNNYNKVCEKWDIVKDKLQLVCDKLVSYKAKLAPVAIKDANLWYNNTIFAKHITPEMQFNTQYDYVVEFLNARKNYLTEILVEANYDTIAK